MTSRSDKFFKQIGELPPLISAAGAKSVSKFRKDQLASDIEAGLYREGIPQKNLLSNDGITAASNVTASVGMKKAGQAASGFGNNTSNIAGGGTGYRGPNDSVKQGPEAYSPLWLNSNLNLPRDRATINAWCRSFFALNPVVHNAINLHSTYPISKLNIRCSDKRVEKFFNAMIEEIDLMNVCVQIAQEYWLLGEAFIYAELDETNAKWSRLLIQNPDYVVVKPSLSANDPNIMLRPDEHLRRIVFSNKPSDIEQKKQLGPNIVEYVKRGQNIPLDSFNVSHIARKISPYEIRGTGLPVNIFRQLVLFDKLRESKFAQADNLINPITLVKVGGPDFKPTPADLETFRNIFESAQNDKDFKIFTHEAVTVERIGAGQGIYDISGDITQLLKEIYIGLMVPPVLMDGGSDISYANGGVALETLRDRYTYFRNMLSDWLKKKIFKPIAKMNDFFEYKNGEKSLIIPEVDWNHMSLFDAGDYITNIINLSANDSKRVSHQTLYRSLGLDYEEEKRKIRKEAIDEEILKKEKASLEKMDLNELRAIGSDDQIDEPEDSDGVPGETTPGEGGAGSPPPPPLPPPA